MRWYRQALGGGDSYDALTEAAIRITGQVQPGPASAVYADAYPRYRALYPALKPTFASLAQ